MTNGGDAGGGRFNQGAAASQHVVHQGKRYTTGGNRQKVPVLERLQVKKKRQEIPGQTGYCSSKIPDDDFCTWLLLAQASGVQVCDYSSYEPGILAEEVRPECCQRQESAESAESRRLECYSRLGMRDFS